MFARLILWRGHTPIITAVCGGLLLIYFVPGLQWGILLAGVLICAVIAGSMVLNSRHTGRVEGLVAQLMRVNHRLNAEIAQRTRVEQELAAARDEALELARIKSQFLATMSHEIRTPMNGIMGMTDLLLDTRLTAEQREYAETVNACSKTLMEIIDDILDFTKIEAATLKLNRREFDPQMIVKGVVEILQSRATAKSLDLTWDAGPDLPAAMIGATNVRDARLTAPEFERKSYVRRTSN